MNTEQLPKARSWARKHFMQEFIEMWRCPNCKTLQQAYSEIEECHKCGKLYQLVFQRSVKRRGGRK